MIRRLLAALLLLPSLAWADYESTVTADNPCHWWKLQDASGNASDSGIRNVPSCAGEGGGSIQNLTVAGSPTYQSSQTAVLGKKSVALSGNGQYFSKDGNPTGLTSTGGQTGEYWARIHGTNVDGHSYGVPFSSYNAGGPSFYSYLDPEDGSPFGQSVAYLKNDGSAWLSVVSGTAASVDTWYYVAWTINYTNTTTGTVTLYVNGASVASSSSPSGTYDGGSVTLSIGGKAGTISQVNGNIQYVGWYYAGPGTNTGVLGSDRILAHYNAGITAATGSMPYTVKRPALPQFHQRDYLAQFVARGYNTGILTEREIHPRLLNIAWLPFSVVPWGNVGAR